MLGARGPMLEVVADASFLTEPVSCEVSNAVGSANRSTALDVQCEPGRGPGCGQSGADCKGPGARVGRGSGGAGIGCRPGLVVLGWCDGAGAGRGRAGACEQRV